MSAYRGNIERLEATLVEMGRGMTYPPTPEFVSPVLTRVEKENPLGPRLFSTGLVLTPRLILIAAIGLILLACAAAATYVATQTTWLRSSDRGVQFTSNFDLVELLRHDDVRVHYQELAIGPEGKRIYALRWIGEEEAELFDPKTVAVVAINGIDEEKVQVEVALRFDDLRDPSLWDPGTDLTGIILPNSNLGLSVTRQDVIFTVADVWNRSAEFPFGALRPEGSPAGTSIIVHGYQGTPQKVLTTKEMAEAGLLGIEALVKPLRITVAASAANHLWLQIVQVELLKDSLPLIHRSIFEVRDPNRDGDWSDRTVTPLTLPSFIAQERRDGCCRFMDLIAEPSLLDDGTPPSFLLLARASDAEQRIYRVADLNGDGDVLDTGEFDLLFSGRRQAPDVVAPRLVVQDGNVVLRELVVSGLTTRTRISRISETGEVIDVARAFISIRDVLADLEGNIYVWAEASDTAGATVLYKLKPEVAE